MVSVHVNGIVFLSLCPVGRVEWVSDLSLQTVLRAKFWLQFLLFRSISPAV